MGFESPLGSFLASPAGINLASFDEVRGFVFAVAGTPELVPPSEWLPEAFNGEMPEFESTQQAQAVVAEVMAMYNAAAAGGRSTKPQAPSFRKETISNLEENAAVARWSRGFSRGYSWGKDSWEEPLPEDLEKELASILLVLSFFSSRRMAEACREETASGRSLEETAEIIRRAFVDAMTGYILLGQSIYRARLEHDRGSTAARAKVGRNEPCPCGSRMKYKRCCGAG